MTQEQLAGDHITLLRKSPYGDVPTGNVGFLADALIDFAILEEGRRYRYLGLPEREYLDRVLVSKMDSTAPQTGESIRLIKSRKPWSKAFDLKTLAIRSPHLTQRIQK